MFIDVRKVTNRKYCIQRVLQNISLEMGGWQATSVGVGKVLDEYGWVGIKELGTTQYQGDAFQDFTKDEVEKSAVSFSMFYFR